MDIIIGGGVTGISYAAFTSNPYMLIEKEKECGGYCRTIARNGFVWDYSGHFSISEIRELKNLFAGT